MPVLIDLIEPLQLNCMIWVGKVSRLEALAVPGRIDPTRPEFGPRWISYFDASAELSELDAACLLELRERRRPVVAGLAAKGEFQAILTSNSRYNDTLVAVWRGMTAIDEAYPSNPVVVRDLHAAARALGLSAADAGRARRWISSRIEAVTRDRS